MDVTVNYDKHSEPGGLVYGTFQQPGDSRSEQPGTLRVATPMASPCFGGWGVAENVLLRPGDGAELAGDRKSRTGGGDRGKDPARSRGWVGVGDAGSVLHAHPDGDAHPDGVYHAAAHQHVPCGVAAHAHPYQHALRVCGKPDSAGLTVSLTCGDGRQGESTWPIRRGQRSALMTETALEHPMPTPGLCRNGSDGTA